MKTGILALTSGGRVLAGKLVADMDEGYLLPVITSVQDTLRSNWTEYDGFVCIMAAGIVVRAIAPLIQDKVTDPCVLVMDQKGEYVISRG